ncbi:hypothetical protein [Halofilum ochraceum]|uniref:hypothetical protein n=1 Tax=Halofilum ochraceum TaxID=1611323 RepID=UPI0008DA2ED8|nr:hypothetical protein [Halofilum ochraceum]
MASFGFKAVSDSGELQLEDAGDFFRFLEGGTSDSVYYESPLPHYEVDFYFNSRVPKSEPLILAIRCDSVDMGMGWYLTDSNGEIRGYHAVCGGPEGANIPYKLFARYGWNTPSPDEDYGMLLWDENGKLVYDSRVVEAHTIDILSISWADGDSASHVDRPGAFYDLPGLDYYYEAYAQPSPTGGFQQMAAFNLYRQSGSGALECYRAEGAVSVTYASDWRNEQTGDGKTIIVDDAP